MPSEPTSLPFLTLTGTKAPVPCLDGPEPTGGSSLVSPSEGSPSLGRTPLSPGVADVGEGEGADGAREVQAEALTAREGARWGDGSSICTLPAGF